MSSQLIANIALKYIPTDLVHQFNNDVEDVMRLKNTTGSLYLIRHREFIKNDENVIKFGRSTNVKKRISQYPKGSSLVFQKECAKHVEAETKLIKILSYKFIQRKDYGREYFEGDADAMIDIINKYIEDPIQYDDIVSYRIKYKKIINDEDYEEPIFSKDIVIDTKNYLGCIELKMASKEPLAMVEQIQKWVYDMRTLYLVEKDMVDQSFLDVFVGSLSPINMRVKKETFYKVLRFSDYLKYSLSENKNRFLQNIEVIVVTSVKTITSY